MQAMLQDTEGHGDGQPQQREEQEPGLSVGQHVTISMAELRVKVNQDEIDPPITQ